MKLEKSQVRKVNTMLASLPASEEDKLTVAGLLGGVFGTKFHGESVEVRVGQVWSHYRKSTGSLEYMIVMERGDGKISLLVLNRDECTAPFEGHGGLLTGEDSIAELIEGASGTKYAFTLVAPTIHSFLAKLVAGELPVTATREKADAAKV